MSAADLRHIGEVAPLLRTRALSSVELVRSCLARIDARPVTNAFITVLRDEALAEAERADREIAGGAYRGPLHGVPVSLKDLIHLSGVPTTSGSRVPAPIPPVDAPVVRRLREAGAIIIGKTNLHEFAFGTTSDETAFGPVRHPLDPTRSAGGSSGGSAASVAEGMSFATVGTDTGGSVRIPAAACGLVGLKPTLGELPCDGVVPLSTTLDHVGPLARSVADAALLFQAMRGSRLEAMSPAEGRLVFGVPRAYFCERLDDGARRALESALDGLRGRGHEARDVVVEGAACTPDVYLHICLPEASWYHAAILEEHAGLYSPGIRLRLEMGRYILAEDYVRAMRLRAALTRAVERALDGVDALLLPALPIAPPPLGATTVEAGGVRMPVRAAMLSLTQLFNITGHPAVALPAGSGEEGLPRSVQLAGRRGGTDRLLAVAAAVEAVLRTSQ